MDSIIAALHSIYTQITHYFLFVFAYIVTVFADLHEFLIHLLDGTLIETLGHLMMLKALTFFTFVFGKLPVLDYSPFGNFCPYVNWFLPLDYGVGCLAILLPIYVAKVTFGWVLKFVI